MKHVITDVSTSPSLYNVSEDLLHFWTSEEGTREWRKLHTQELGGLCFSGKYPGGRFKKNDIGGACDTYKVEETVYMLW